MISRKQAFLALLLSLSTIALMVCAHARSALAAAFFEPPKLYIANVTPYSFDVIWLTTQDENASLRFGTTSSPNAWSPANTGFSVTNNEPCRLHWFRAFPGVSAQGAYLYFEVLGDSFSTVIPIRMPSVSDAPTAITPIRGSLKTATGAPLFANDAIVLLRIRNGYMKSAYRAVHISGDVLQINASLAGLPMAIGEPDSEKTTIFDTQMNPVGGSLVELVALSGGRITRTATTTVIDSKLMTVEPPLEDLYFTLAPPYLSAPLSIQTGNFTVSWPAVEDAQNYEIQRATTGAWQTIATLSPVAEPSILQTSLAYGLYRYRARSISLNSSLSSEWSQIIEVSVLPAPTNAPTSTTVLLQHSATPVVKWNPVSAPVSGAAYWYEVQWSLDEDFSTFESAITDGTSLSIPINSLGLFYVRIRAILPSYGENIVAGDWCDAFTISVTIGVPMLYLPSFSGTPRVEVSWSGVDAIPVGTAVEYELQSSRSASFSSFEIEYQGLSLKRAVWFYENGIHYVRVRAITESGTGEWSQAETILIAASAELAPQDLRAYPSIGEINIAWSIAYPPETRQTVQRSSNGSDWTTIAAEIVGDWHTDGFVDEGKTYKYRVGSHFGSKTLWSEIISAKALYKTPASYARSVSLVEETDKPFFAFQKNSPDAVLAMRGEISSSVTWVQPTEFVSYFNTGGSDSPLGAGLVSADKYTVLYGKMGTGGLLGLYGRSITFGGGGFSTVFGAESKISDQYSDVQTVAVCSGNGFVAAVYFDSLSASYFVRFSDDGENWSKPFFIAETADLWSNSAHRPAATFDEQGNLHVAVLTKVGSSFSLVYGILLRLSVSQLRYPFAEFEQHQTPLFASSTIELCGLCTDGLNPTISWIEYGPASTTLGYCSARFLPSGILWSDFGFVKSDILWAKQLRVGGKTMFATVSYDHSFREQVLSLSSLGLDGWEDLVVASATEIRSADAFAASKAVTFAFVDELGFLGYARKEIESDSSVIPIKGGGGGGGCFIATAAFGNMANLGIRRLISFRDGEASCSAIGVGLCRTYYELSPSVAERVNDCATARAATRRLISLLLN